MKRLVVCVLIAGCGGDGDNGSIDIDNLGIELGIAGCAKQWDCCTDTELMEQYMGITYDGMPIDSEERCVEFANAVLTGLAVAQYKESLAKGRIEYDGEAAADCVAALSGLSCAEYSAKQLPTASCGPFTHPKVADGGACTQDYECTSANCVGESNPLGEPSTDGECMPMPAEGDPCDDNCPGDLICDADIGSGMETCRPARPDGEQCNLDDQCASDYCDRASGSGVCGVEPVTCDGR
ncbi:MAG: hypothetical protein AB7T06_15500 [Kofleriaceae bacterium]